MTNENDTLKNQVTRRKMLRTGASGIALAIAGNGMAQVVLPTPKPKSKPRIKGPLVWRNMDQAELESALSQIEYAPNMMQVIKRYQVNSANTIERLGSPQNFSYGDTPIEKINLYTVKNKDAPIHIFIHGCAWSITHAKDSLFLANMFVHAGAHFIAPDFAWVQDVGGDLMVLAKQVRESVAWVYRNARNFGGDREKIYISGHSSGAHLAAVVLTTDWKKEFQLPENIIKGGVCCGGSYELEPSRLSKKRSYVNFTEEVMQKLSPMRNVERLNAPVIAAYGSLEPEEYQWQANELVRLAKRANKSAEVLVVDGYNHFEAIETLANPHGILGQAVLKQMKII